jgi:hypothetical protein
MNLYRFKKWEIGDFGLKLSKMDLRGKLENKCGVGVDLIIIFEKCL